MARTLSTVARCGPTLTAVADTQHIGERIRRARERRLMSQQELAAATGVSARTLRRIEAGEVQRSKAITVLLEYLGIHPEHPASHDAVTDPQRALRTVSTPELLAELAARIAALEARAADRPLPRGIGIRAAVSWRTVDDPSRRSGRGDEEVNS